MTYEHCSDDSDVEKSTWKSSFYSSAPLYSWLTKNSKVTYCETYKRQKMRERRLGKRKIDNAKRANEREKRWGKDGKFSFFIHNIISFRCCWICFPSCAFVSRTRVSSLCLSEESRKWQKSLFFKHLEREEECRHQNEHHVFECHRRRTKADFKATRQTESNICAHKNLSIKLKNRRLVDYQSLSHFFVFGEPTQQR